MDRVTRKRLSKPSPSPNVQGREDNGIIPSITELTSQWTDNLHVFPTVAHTDVEGYLISSSHRTDDNKTMQCYRQYVRGFNFYKENYIHNVMVNTMDRNDVCFIRSNCYPSMKQGSYEQWLLVAMQPFNVTKAHCTCPAGLGEGCTHIAGLLFALEDITCKLKSRSVEDKEDPKVPCTSKPCKWNKPKKRKKQATTVNNLQFKKFRYGQEETLKTKSSNFSVSQVDGNDFLTTLTSKLGCFNAVLLDLLKNEQQTDSVICHDVNVAKIEEVSTSEELFFESDRYVSLIESADIESIDSEGKFDKFVNISDSLVNEIEERTRGQSNNQLWTELRKFRLTSSSFHDVMVRRDTTDPSVLTKKLTGGCDEVKTAALVWGRKREIVARKKFVAYKKLFHKETVHVSDCGMFLCKERCYLGASPDGIIHSKSGVQRLLEIKCPYKWRFHTVTEACEDKSFCLYKDDKSQLHLKKTHRYYTQVQGQMAVCQMSLCDFVVYTKKDLKIITVSFDKQFWEELQPKLDIFYRRNILPLILQRGNKNPK